MALSVTNFGNNPQQPGIIADAYIPDQLIAGNLKLVTQPITLTGAAALTRGTVLGQVSIGAAGAATAFGAGGGANTGNGVISAIAPQVRAKVGTYTIKFTGATTYTVTDPTGNQLAAGVAAGAYADAQLNFTFTAGGAPMVAGDGFQIVIAAGAGSYKKAVATATDGSATPVAILVDDADASGGDVAAAAYLMGEFNGSAIIYDASFTLATVTAQLRPSSIFIKSYVSAADPS